MDVTKMETAINALIKSISEIRPVVNEFSVCIKDATQRIYTIENYIETQRKMNAGIAGKDAVKSLSSKLMVASNSLKDFANTYNAVLKGVEKVVRLYEDHLSHANIEYGGVGFDTSLLSDRDGIDFDCFTDDGFVALLKEIKAEKNVFDRMDLIVKALRDSVEITNDLRRKHEKLNERKRLGGGSYGETDAVRALRRRVMKSEDIHHARVGKLLEAYGSCRKKILGFLDGSTESVALIVGESKMSTVARERLDDIAFRVSQITKNDNYAKGVK